MTTTNKKKKPSFAASAFTSFAAQLLLRRRGREAASNGDSIEFFSDLRKCQPAEPRGTGQTGRGGGGRTEDDGRGTARLRGSIAGSHELLSLDIEKHEYDWLLAPPATPLRSPARSASGHQASAAVPNQDQQLLAAGAAGSVSNEKNKSLLGTRDWVKQNATSRLARSSSASTKSAIKTPAAIASPAGSHHLPRVRTQSSSSASSAGSLTSLASAAGSSPRTPVTARSTGRPCRRDKASTSSVAVARQPRAPSSSSRTSSSSGHPVPTCATPSVVSSPRPTASTCQKQKLPPTPSKRADAVVAARSRLASPGSTAQAASSSSPTTASRPRDVHPARGEGSRALRSPSTTDCIIKAIKKQTGVAAAASTTTTTQQRWRRQSRLTPAVAAAARSARRSEASSVDNGSLRSSAGRKISADKATAPAPSPAVGSGLARAASQPKSACGIAPTEASGPRDAKHGDGAVARRKPTNLQLCTSRSVSSTSRLGLTRTTSKASAGSIAKGRRAAVPGSIGSGASDAFPSSRYDAMLLLEDPRNLTWLRGCDDDGLELVDGSLEPFDVATDLSIICTIQN